MSPLLSGLSVTVNWIPDINIKGRRDSFCPLISGVPGRNMVGVVRKGGDAHLMAARKQGEGTGREVMSL